MPVSVTCPPVERLQDLAVGRVSDADLESLGSHVLECGRCGETISRLHVSDTIADALQAVRRVRLELPSGVLDAAIQQACQLAEQTSADAIDDTQSPASSQESTGSADASRETDLPFDPAEILAPPRSPDELGRLGPYRVLRLLGAGGMGLVFLAEDERLKRPVAIKAIRPALAASRDSRQRFLREARAAAALRHDHIVTVHQVGAHGGTLWLAMELLEGESLHARLHRDQRLTPLEAVRIACQIAEALAAAHSLGLVHRDIKPANVWLENRTSGAGERLPPRVKVLDFGLARTAAEDAQITQSGVIVGTPAYMAPEQARGDHVDAKCDLFSLGCVLYRMLAGHAPFRGHGTMAVLMALATHNPPPVRSLAPDVPDELDALTSRLLAKNPADRPHTATTVACALAAIEAQIVSPPPPVQLPEGRGETLSNEPKTRKPITRVHWLVASAIAALVGCLALAGVLLQITTPHGTIVLEVNQPELLGAVVTVDDKQSITIKTNDSPEPIKVVADEKQHLLKVEKGGFATFTHAFTVQSGKTQTIRVRLRPLQVGSDTTPVGPTAHKDQPGEIATVNLPQAAQAKGNQPAIAKTAETDQLQAGTVWYGARTYRKGFWEGQTVAYELYVHERSGAKFKGHSFNNGPARNRCELEGEVHGQSISWLEQTLDPQRQNLIRGTLDDNTIRFALQSKFLSGALATEADGELVLTPGKSSSNVQPAVASNPKPEPATLTSIPAPRGTVLNEPLGDAGFIPVNSEGNPLNLNFELGTLADWKAEGKAFSGQPVKGDASVTKRGKKSNHTGKYWIGGYELSGDAPQGTLTSQTFVVSHPFASYLIGGGFSTKTRVEIVTAEKNLIFHSASGNNAEAMKPVVVDLNKIIGQRIFIRLVDENSADGANGWGHINFDDFRFHKTEPKF